MAVEEMDRYAQRVLTTVSRLTAGGVTGINVVTVVTALDEKQGGQGIAPEPEFAVVVAQLRSHGLLMTNPAGDLRVTSAGQHWLADAPAPGAEGPTP